MTHEAIVSLCKATAIFSFVAGGYGMILCVPYIMSTSIYVIAAASLPFIAGAVLVAGGLTSYTILLKK